MEQVKPQLKFNLSGGSFPAWSKHESIVKNLIWETLVHKPTVAHQEEKYQGVKFK